MNSGAERKMKGLLLHGPGKIELTDLPMPDVGEDEVLVKVAACGVCNATDLKVFKGINQYWNDGEYPCTMGHEVTGTVAGFGRDVGGFKEGDRVFMRITLTGFAEYAKWRADHVHLLPEAIGFDEGTLGQLMPIGVRGLQRSMKPGCHVLVAGAGPAGMLCLMMARAMGAGQVIVTEISPFRTELALELGADAVINPTTEDLKTRMEELGGPVDASVECAGIRQTLAQCEELTRPGGTIAVFGSHLDPVTLDLAEWESKSLSLVIAREQPEETPRLLWRTAELMTHPEVQLSRLISHRLPLEEITDAFDLLDRRVEGVMKIVVSPE